MQNKHKAFLIAWIAQNLKDAPLIYSFLGQEVFQDLRSYFSEKIQETTSKKINDIIIDPGFGFAKTTEQNYTLLNHLDLFQTFGLPILIGLSRKSMIYKVLESSPQEALNGTTALHTIALLKGANITRAHDVKEAMECVKLVEVLKENAL